MSAYDPPIAELRHLLDNVADVSGLAALPGYEAMEPELVDQVLAESGKFAARVLAPLNQVGDRQGARLHADTVRTPDGFTEAYSQFVAAGWPALPFDVEAGGQGLPWTLGLAVGELWSAANMAWALCPLLTAGAVELLQVHGTPAQKATYLPRLVAGDWTGTMNLTEPQAGSDLGALKTRAVPAENGRYRITGQKIFITYGEHDLTGNIVHMVLARLPGAPAGTKGLSLFLVPKYLPDETGAPGARNDLRCVSIETKMGIHAAPTCTLAFGDSGGAVGELVGTENGGMAAMFTMMNNARLNIGVQGLGLAERAYQAARAHAFERVQSRAIDSADPTPVPIVRHPDVRRMLLSMKAEIAATRCLALAAGGALDRARRHPEPEARKAAQARVDLLTPVVKARGSDLGVRASSTAVQVLGGMGYTEDLGVAQHYRDARIAPIYEGTNGIQALDLVGRKVLRDDGRALRVFLADLESDLAALAAAGEMSLHAAGRRALDTLDRASRHLLDLGHRDPAAAAAVATTYLDLLGVVAGGVLLARAAAAPRHGTADKARVDLARFYAARVLPQADALAAELQDGAAPTLAPAPDDL